MPSAPDGVLSISICYISVHARCSWRIKSDRFMRSTGSEFRLELRGICLKYGQARCHEVIGDNFPPFVPPEEEQRVLLLVGHQALIRRVSCTHRSVVS